jgi:hypothetical protein
VQQLAVNHHVVGRLLFPTYRITSGEPMHNQLLSFDDVYRMVRQHSLIEFPQHAECSSQKTVNAYLKSSGSSLHAPGPGLNFSHRTGDVISEFDHFIITDKNREALYADIADMVRWLRDNGYLLRSLEDELCFYPTDKLLRTSSLVF